LDNELTLVPTNQRRNIEILKIRFREAAPQMCEVMLKDMTDSMGMSNLRKLFVVLLFVESQKLMCALLQSNKHPMIISKHFWPALESNGMDMPGQFQEYVPRF